MKEKTDKLDLRKIKNFFSVKRHCEENEKASHRVGENICKTPSNKRLIYKIYKKTLKTQQ